MLTRRFALTEPNDDETDDEDEAETTPTTFEKLSKSDFLHGVVLLLEKSTPATTEGPRSRTNRTSLFFTAASAAICMSIQQRQNEAGAPSTRIRRLAPIPFARLLFDDDDGS